MNSIISLVVIDQEPRVDSRVIADQLGVEHESTRKILLQYQSDFEEFGILRFEIGEIKGRGQPAKYALLNEDQSYLLLTYSQNTEQARDLKKRLVRAFGEQRRAMAVAITLPAVSALPIQESSLVLDYQGVPIRFIIDAHGDWMATYKDVATALGFVNKEQQYSARNILKYTVKAGERQLRHPLYGDLISLAGVERILAQFARNAACEPERAVLAANLKGWLAHVAAPLVAQPASAGFLLSQQWAPPAGQLALAYDPDYQQSAHILTLWHESLGESSYRAADVLAQAQGPLVEALADIAQNRWYNPVPSAKKLGKWLSLRQGQVVDGLKIVSEKDRSRNVRLWCVKAAA